MSEATSQINHAVESARPDPALTERLIRALIDIFPGLISAKDENSRYVIMNRFQAELYGTSPEAALGKTASDLIHDDYGAYTAMNDRRALELGQTLTYEETTPAADGQPRDWLTIKVPFTAREDDARPNRVLNISIDIADRKQAERAARESTERLELAVAACDLGFYDWDIERNQVYFSPHWCGQLGYTQAEVVPVYESWRDRLHPDDFAATVAALQASLAEPWPPYEVEFRLRHRDGSYRWIATRGALTRSAEGRPLRLVGTHLDITARKRAEEERAALARELLARQKLESIGLLAGGVAHEFSNVLTAILGNTNLATLLLPPDAELQRYLSYIDSSARRASDLCQQLLDFAGRGPYFPRAIDLSILAEQTVKFVRASLPKGLHVSYELARGLVVTADATQVRQALINLLLNAGEAGGGQVIVRTGYAEATVDGTGYVTAPPAPGRYAFVEVADNGRGMDAETLSRAFDPFFSTRDSGPGLGLPAVVGIVRGHDGAVHVTTAPGEGVRVRLLFPLPKK